MSPGFSCRASSRSSAAKSKSRPCLSFTEGAYCEPCEGVGEGCPVLWGRGVSELENEGTGEGGAGAQSRPPVRSFCRLSIESMVREGMPSLSLMKERALCREGVGDGER